MECTSPLYGAFRFFAWLFVVISQSIPVMYWAMLMPHVESKLNPVFVGGSAQGDHGRHSPLFSTVSLIQLTSFTPASTLQAAMRCAKRTSRPESSLRCASSSSITSVNIGTLNALSRFGAYFLSPCSRSSRTLGRGG